MRQITKIKSWQVEALQIGRPAQHFLIQSPGGAGKSLLQVMLAQADIEDTGNKQLILVPKSHIHHGFFDDDAIEMTLPGEAKASKWIVKNNFCALSKHDPKIEALKEWLLSDIRDVRQVGGLAAIATHKAMVEAWSSFSKEQKEAALRHISFRIDEAHHLSNVFHESDLGLYNTKDRQAIVRDGTRLGNFLQYVLRHESETVKVHLATATFFRGDRRTILSSRFKADFAHYYLPWDDHYQSLGIDELTFDFVNYAGPDPIETVLDMVRTEPKERHLIIIPALNHRFRDQKTFAKLLKGILKIVPANAVLDLVSKETQDANKVALHKQPDKYRVVIACRLFDEGTDWVPCTRMHNTDACEQSITLAIQRFFRPLRAHPAKKKVRIFNYLPELAQSMTDEQKRQILSNRLNAFLACIATQGELVPVLVPLAGMPRGTKPRKMSSLQELFGEEYFDVLEALVGGYEAAKDKSNPEQMEAIADRILKNYEFEGVAQEDVKDALLVLLGRIARPAKQLGKKELEPEGIDADSIRLKGFDKVWEKVSPVESVLLFGTDNIDVSAIRHLLSIVKTIPTLSEIHEGIKAFHGRTGKRPTFHQAEWMDELDRSANAVDKVIRRHYGSTLAAEVCKALGGGNDDLIARTHDLIRDYWTRGIRLGTKFGDIPEIGMSSLALNGRLSWNHGTTLAKEVEKLLGPHTKPLTLPKVKQVVRGYLKKGVRLTRKFGHIPELDMSSFNLSDRLQRNFGVTMSELIEECAG